MKARTFFAILGGVILFAVAFINSPLLFAVLEAHQGRRIPLMEGMEIVRLVRNGSTFAALIAGFMMLGLAFTGKCDSGNVATNEPAQET